MSDCPTIDAWEALASARVAPTEAADLRRHADACPSCRELLARIVRNEAVLASIRRAFDGPIPAPAPPLIGRRIGAYLITGLLGSGGMATVYEALQDHPRRTVAFKILARGLSSPASLARFRQEAELLGRLHHHGIAQVFDAGADDDGRPFFAMELVRGRTVTDHARHSGLDRRARLSLLARVCDAVQYAHEHGVIHRDLKPSNILIDEHGQPKILDFGVARASELDSRSTTLRTEPGQLVGTIAYMSPEQAAADPDAIDARADVYALGVVLFELLTGRPPFDLCNRSALESLRTIEAQPAPRLGAIDRALRGDPEVIAAKALEKDRERRYHSAAALASDIRRYLDGAPIAARPATALYRARTFAHRNRLLVGAAAALFAALSLGLAGTAYGLWRSERRRATAEAVSALLESALRTANPDEVRGAGYTVRQLVDELSRGVHERLAGQPEVEARIRTVLGNAYRVMGEPRKADEHLSAALSLRRVLHGDRHPLVARAMCDLAHVRHDQADYGGAISLLREALAMQQALLGPRHLDTASSELLLSDVLRHTAAFDQAESLGRHALETRQSLLGDDHPDTAECLANLSKLARDRGDLSSAEQYLDRALSIWERAYGAEHPRLVDGLNDRAWLEYQRRDVTAATATLSRALDMGRRLLGNTHPDVGNAIYELAAVNRDRPDHPDPDAAETGFREALAIYRAAYGDAHPSVWNTLDAIADVLIRSRHDYTDAEPLAREALEGRRALFGPRGGETALSLNTVARILKAQGKRDDAEAMYRDALDALRAAYGPDHAYVSLASHDLGLLLQDKQDWQGAEAMLREALRINQSALGPQHADSILAATSLARLFNSRSRFAEADAVLTPLAPGLRSGPQTIRVANALDAHAAALAGLERRADAAEALAAEADALTAALGPAHERTRKVLESLAAAYEAIPDPDKAAQARARLAAARPPPGK